MQLDGRRIQSAGGTPDGVADAFMDWAQAHHAFGGDFDQSALAAGIQATMAAYGSGLALDEAFESGRRAYYSALG